MRTPLLAILVLACLVQFSEAQELGIRLGDNADNHFAIDGIFGIGELDRIHADVSFGHGGVGVEALWDFLYDSLGADNLDWYVGAGPSAFIGDPLEMGVSGEIGLEFHFDVPLAIGVDWRPIFILCKDTDFYADRLGLNIRYVF